MTIIRYFRPTFFASQHRLFLPLIFTRSYSVPPLFKSRPAPVPLADPQEQKEFEELVRENQGSLVNSQTEELTHPDLRKKQPQFDGDKNPETGEIGGPKQEPLMHGDWSYGARVTDF